MGKRIVVTGAAGALGKAVIAALTSQGHDIVGIDIGDAPEGAGAFVGGVDLTDEASTRSAFERIAKDGPIHGLANIAGGFVWETVADGDLASWQRMFAMNVVTALNASRAALPFLGSGASIVNIGAAATARAGTGMGAYTASKSGVARLTEALAEEVKDRTIRVNAVLPSILDTPANRADMGEADADKWVKGEELSAVIAFLLSDAASAVTGASIPVTGRV
ncbi:SDR family oxidoreductase [Croceicoccus sp. Ery15]|uniref:SDR family oxidoreductase n=1 Tax=Croceicoccus sp. Ery15 TaxID=1703338 RepID=UPI001E3146C0|nr:SDR family oxidoreductase [Croceicoccus sp. Ery15]